MSPPPRSRAARDWLAFALVSLLIGGALSLVLITGRVPGMTKFFDAPMLAKRSLVVHVNLVLSCWSFGFIVALASFLPGSATGRLPFFLSVAGAALFSLAGLLGAEPILSNYVPVLDHPVFVTGLVLFYIGAALAFARSPLLWRRRPVDAPLPPEGPSALFTSPTAVVGLSVAAWTFMLGLTVQVAAVIMTPRTLAPPMYYEALFWGAGHIFQFSYVSALMVVWLVLAEEVGGRSPIVRPGLEKALFGFLLVPTLPALALLGVGPQEDRYFAAFTEMMRWGTSAAPSLTVWLCAYAVLRRGRPRWSSSLAALGASVALIALGIYLGTQINRASTLVPAHYHATVGAVTVAFMGAAYRLLEALDMPLRSARHQRLARWQPAIFGVGQLAFVAGFAYAGRYGLGRKVYGSEQTVQSVQQAVGLAVMGTGGLLALVGGALFTYLVSRAWGARVSSSAGSQASVATGIVK